MKNISFKLIFRSWQRNRTFTVISILSLAVGMACTNLLVAFVIHEYNVEAKNPYKNRIYCLVQDSPFQSGEKVFFTGHDVLTSIRNHYPEVEDYLCLNLEGISQITVGETVYDPIVLLQAEASFLRFFPYRVLEGNLEEALTEPGRIALTETTAQRFFGRENPVGQTVYINKTPDEGATYQVVAVIKEYDQAALSFDGITAMEAEYGGTSFLLMNQSVDTEQFAFRLKEGGIPTFMKDEGRYYLYTLQENYFKEYTSQSLPYINRQNRLTLNIGFFSALLILLTGCFNYINLNLSRLLRQVRILHIQQLMGASNIEINKQFFVDIFFTVLAGFILSLLIMYDLVPVFNAVLSGKMNISFIFSGQVLPLLAGLMLILSVIPAVYMSRKMSVLSRQRYHDLTGGKKKQNIISTLSVIQFVISFILIIATLTVSKQTGLIRQGGEGYEGLIEIELQGNAGNRKSFIEDLRTHPEIGEVNTTMLSLFHYGIRQIVIPDGNGSETYLSLAELGGGTGFLSNFRIKLLQGLQPGEAKARFPFPVYVNRRFADIFVEKGENPVGQPLKRYNKNVDFRHKEDAPEQTPVTTIVGVVEDFFIGSLEQEIPPAIIHIEEGKNITDAYVYFRLDDKHPERLARVRQIWEKHNPGKLFTYSNVFEDFLTLNQKTIGLADLLLMYSLISILLTCFGIFGIALYAARQRTKEIGIRKVNGSTTWQIMMMLNRQFMVWVGIAYVIAVPVAWWILHPWMRNFVYRAGFSLWTYILPLLIVSGVTLLTVGWHSYKAATGNPVGALRDE